MDTDATCHTFRPNKLCLYMAIVFTFLFGAAVIICLCVPYFPETKNPPTSEEATVFIMVMGVVVFGTMFLLSLFMWRSYYVERLTISGSRVSVLSMLASHEFDKTEIQQILWSEMYHGLIRVRLAGSTARIYTSNFGKENQLAIIRLFKAMVPLEKQEGWPRFCDRIAIPLRDGARLKRREQPPASPITVTRSRYDRLFILTFPMTLAAAIGFGYAFSSWQFALLPLSLVAFWLLLRISMPKEGMVDERVFRSRSPQKKGAIAFWGGLVIPTLVMFALDLSGVARGGNLCLIGAATMLPFLVYGMRMTLIADRMTSEEEQAAIEAWEEKEEAAQPRELVEAA